MWLPRLWIISSLLILAAAITGARVTPDQGAERARLAETITLQLKQHALEQAAELASLAGDPQLISVMSPERLWSSPSQRTERLSELRESLLTRGGAQLTQDVMILDSKLSRLCQGLDCSYEPLLSWSAQLKPQEVVEALTLKPLHLTERISPPRWAWVGQARQLVVTTSISQKTTLGVLVGLGATAEQLFKKELARKSLSEEHFALFLGEAQLTALEVEPPKTNAPQELMVKPARSQVTWRDYLAQVKVGFTSFKNDPLPLLIALALAVIWLLLDSRRASSAPAPTEESFGYDWDLPPSEDLRSTEPALNARSPEPMNPTSDLPLSTHPDELDQRSAEERGAHVSSSDEVVTGSQSPSVPPIIHGEAATPLHAIKTDEFEPADAPEFEGEHVLAPDPQEGSTFDENSLAEVDEDDVDQPLHEESGERPLSQEDEDAFDELFDELSEGPLEGDSFVQELGSFLEGELGDLLGAQGQSHLAALDEAAWSQAPAELAPPRPEDPSEYEDFERDISEGLGEVFADELSDPDDFFKHIGLVSAFGAELLGDVELVQSIAPMSLEPEEESAPSDSELPEPEEESASIAFEELGLVEESSDVSLDEVEVVQSTQPVSLPAEPQDALSDFEGSLDLEDDFPDVLDEQAGDHFHPDLDLTPLPSEEDFRRTPERESQLGELLHGVASIPPADERPTTLSPLTQEAPVDDISAELMGQEDMHMYSDEWAVPPAQDDERRPVPSELDLLKGGGVHSLDELPVSLDDSQDLEGAPSIDEADQLEDGFISQWEEDEDDEPVHYQELQRAEEMALNPTPFALPTEEKIDELSLNPIEAPIDEEEGGLDWGQESIAPTPVRSSEGDLSEQQLKALDAFMNFSQEHDEHDDYEELLAQDPLASMPEDEGFEHDPGSMVESGSLAGVNDLMSLMESEPAPRSASAEEMGFHHEPTPEPEPIASPQVESSLTPEPEYEPEYEPVVDDEPEPDDHEPIIAPSHPEPASVEDLASVASLAPQAIPAVETSVDLTPPKMTPAPIDWAAKARERRQARLDHYKEIYLSYCELKKEHEPESRLPSLKDFIDQLNQARQKYIEKHGCLDVRFEAKLNKKGRVSIKSREHTPV